MTARVLSTGERLYPAGSLPEGVVVDASSAWLLVIAMHDPSPAEIRAVSSGAIDLAIDRDGPVLTWYVRVPECLDWSATAWAWWERTAPEVPPDQPGVGGLVAVVLVDGPTTIIRACRTVGLTQRVADALRDLEDKAQYAGRYTTTLDRERAWATRAESREVESRVKLAAIVTGVAAKLAGQN